MIAMTTTKNEDCGWRWRVGWHIYDSPAAFVIRHARRSLPATYSVSRERTRHLSSSKLSFRARPEFVRKPTRRTFVAGSTRTDSKQCKTTTTEMLLLLRQQHSLRFIETESKRWAARGCWGDGTEWWFGVWSMVVSVELSIWWRRKQPWLKYFVKVATITMSRFYKLGQLELINILASDHFLISWDDCFYIIYIYLMLNFSYLDQISFTISKRMMGSIRCLLSIYIHL